MRSRLPVAVVIPVFNPEPGLLVLCRELCVSFAHVIIVDDGSTEDRARFKALPREVLRLSHTVNRGKGRAMKTAIEYVRTNLPEVPAVIFADGDGQHAPVDIRAVAERVLVTNEVTFGVRDITWANAPFRSWWGNRWTALEVRLLFGLRVTDTQTGLRGIPSRLFADFVTLHGERFEFEARQFGWLARRGEHLQQISIQTIYVHGNRASHFRPLRDTLLTQFALVWNGPHLKAEGQICYNTRTFQMKGVENYENDMAAVED